MEAEGCALAGTDYRPTPLRRRAGRPQLKRDPLGSTTARVPRDQHCGAGCRRRESRDSENPKPDPSHLAAVWPSTYVGARPFLEVLMRSLALSGLLVALAAGRAVSQRLPAPLPSARTHVAHGPAIPAQVTPEPGIHSPLLTAAGPGLLGWRVARPTGHAGRSEERRVGEEGRSRWSPDH